jgi:hypothetical protein
VNQAPIVKALSILLDNQVRALVIGGQACIFYGGAEFSRDLDLAVLVSARNLDRLRRALDLLDARPVYVPDLSEEVLAAGHACHFRCYAEGLLDLRLDVMGRMRGTEDFEALWARRNDVAIEGGLSVPVLSLPDLVRTKKTQRDKDWPMIRRLVEADKAQAGLSSQRPSDERIVFWFLECRTPELLTELAGLYPSVAAEAATCRPLLREAMTGNADALAAALRREEDEERARDRAYWAPLLAQLRAWRQRRRA